MLHQRYARNIKTYNTNDPAVDINEADDATDPVDDDDYVTNDSKLLWAGIKSIKTTRKAGIHLFIRRFMFCSSPLDSFSVFRCSVIYYGAKNTNTGNSFTL